MRPVNLLSEHRSGHSRLPAVLAARTPVYHRQFIPLPYLLLAILAGLCVIAYLIWPGQNQASHRPGGTRFRSPRRGSGGQDQEP
jgi:hypothetical protein